MLNIILGLVAGLIRPLAALAAKGAVKLVKMTSIKEDDEFLAALAEELVKSTKAE